jgi:hypothetical protein
MDRRGNWLGAVACGTLAAVASVGCADPETSIFIQHNLKIESPACVARSDPEATSLGSGLLDVAFNLEYTASLLVGNQLTPRGEKPKLRPETMRVQLRGAEVMLTDLQGNVIEDSFSVPGTGFIDPSAGENPGYGVTFAELIPATVGDRLRRQLEPVGRGASRTVIAEVRVFGDTLGGAEVESGPFIYPITVCYGCSVFFPLDALQATNNQQLCTNVGDFSGEFACRMGQDEGTDCRLCVGDYPEVCLVAGQ